MTQRTAWFLLHRIRHQFGFDDPTDGEQLSGRVEADETFVGGKNKNRHRDKKVPQSQGRAHIDKTPVLGLLQEQVSEFIERPHKVIADRIVIEKIVLQKSILKCRVIPDTSSKNIHPLVKELVKANSTFISDEWIAYHGLNKHYDHRVVDHRSGQYVTLAGDTTNALEGAWTGLKMSIISIYHGVSRKHLPNYANEMAYRYNTRNLREDQRMNHTLSIKGETLKYRELTGNGQEK